MIFATFRAMRRLLALCLSHIDSTSAVRWPYRTPKSRYSCGCRRNSAVAAGPPYGESLCFTGRKGGRRIIARSYNFFHFYVRRRNLSHRSHAVDASTATIRRTYGGRTEALRQSVASVWPHGRRTFTVRSPCGRLAYALIFVIKTTAAAGTPYGDRASSPQRT